MSDKESNGKLDTELVHRKIDQTGTQRFKLKFTDYAVDKFFASFFIDGKLIDRKYVPLMFLATPYSKD